MEKYDINILRKVDKCKGESFVKKITESGAVIVPIKIRLKDSLKINIRFFMLYNYKNKY